MNAMNAIDDTAGDSQWVTGGCLCGAVRYRARRPLRPAVACHCSQCRRTSGNYVNATCVARENLTLTCSEGLKWYTSSDYAERGFCRECGSSVLWSAHERDTITIMCGTIDGDTGIETVAHICVADKGDYYEINPSEPQYAGTDYPSPSPGPPSDG